MNWGRGITLAFVLFALFIGSLVGIALNTDFYLVSEDYYDAEINYETQIQKIKAYDDLSEKISFEYNKNSSQALLTLPDELRDKNVEGTIHFFRPSDANLDQVIEMEFDDNGKMPMNLASLEKGLWRIKLEFSTGDRQDFYHEQVVIL